MLILYNATASFYAYNSFFFLLRQPLFTHTILFSFYCDSLFLRTQFIFFLMRQPLFTHTVLFSFLLNERYHLKSSPSSH